MSGFSFGPSIGLWTPTLIGSATPGTGQTYSAQRGSYELIGRQVTLRFRIVATSLGTAAGNMQIGGLPFGVVNIVDENGKCFITNYTIAGHAASNLGVTGYLSAASSVISLEQNSSTGSAFLTVAQTGAAGAFEGFATYWAA